MACMLPLIEPAEDGSAVMEYREMLADVELQRCLTLTCCYRCALLCKAALEAPWLVPCGGAPYGDNNLIFIANDWHTALLPVYLQVHTLCHNHLSALLQHARSAF